MFSGIVEEKAQVKKIFRNSRGCRLVVECGAVSNDVKRGDSISVNGVCLTVVGVEGKSVSFDIMEETLRTTTFSEIYAGDVVNLERSLKVGDRISGHFVTGHIDCIGKVISMSIKSNDCVMEVEIPRDKSIYLTEKGSIAVNGISLTITDTKDSRLKICLIPFTLKTTNLGLKKDGDRINIEFDILSKYSLRNLSSAKSKIDAKFLEKHGFI